MVPATASSAWRDARAEPLPAPTSTTRRAVTAGRRHGLDLTGATPKLARDVLTGDELVIAVCDRAYEELDAQPLHWSVPDPALDDNPAAFETAYDDVTSRVDLLAASLEGDPT